MAPLQQSLTSLPVSIAGLERPSCLTRGWSPDYWQDYYQYQNISAQELQRCLFRLLPRKIEAHLTIPLRVISPFRANLDKKEKMHPAFKYTLKITA